MWLACSSLLHLGALASPTLSSTFGSSACIQIDAAAVYAEASQAVTIERFKAGSPYIHSDSHCECTQPCLRLPPETCSDAESSSSRALSACRWAMTSLLLKLSGQAGPRAMHSLFLPLHRLWSSQGNPTRHHSAVKLCKARSCHHTSHGPHMATLHNPVVFKGNPTQPHAQESVPCEGNPD